MKKRLVQIFAIPRSGIHMFSEWLIAGWGHGMYVQQYRFPLDIDLAPSAENLIIVHEDPYQLNSEQKIADLREMDSIYGKGECVIFLRDIYNLAASKIKAKDRTRVDWRYYWHDRSTEDWLKMICETEIPLIYYNRFLINEEYRRQLAARFDVDYNTAELQRTTEVAKHGGGSSFTGRRTVPGIEDAVFRWKEVLDTEEFKSVLQNEQARRVNEILFGWYLTKEGRLVGDPRTDLRRG